MEYVYIILAYLTAGLLLAIFEIVNSDRSKFDILLPYYIFTAFAPTFGYGMWHHKKLALSKQKRIQSPVYYIFNKMWIPHLIFFPIFFIIPFLFGDNIIMEFFFILVYFTLISFGGYLLIFLFIFLIIFGGPSLIAKILLKDKTDPMIEILDSEGGDQQINMKDWERSKPPENIDELDFEIDDEYISLDDKEDDFTIDL